MPSDATYASWTTGGPTATSMSAAVPRREAADDARLVEAALAGDTAAFDELVTRHRRSVYQVCFRFVRHHEDAADLTQDTFVRAWKALGSFRGHARFSTWIYRIAVNVSLNKVSAKTPATAAVDFDLMPDARTPAPGDGLAREEQRLAVRRAVESLPARQRTVLVLRTYHELSVQEVADIVGTSVGAVKANVFHALANLRKRLGPLR